MITKVKVAESDVNQYIRYFLILMLDNKQKCRFDDCAHMAHCFRFVRLCVRACEGARGRRICRRASRRRLRVEHLLK